MTRYLLLLFNVESLFQIIYWVLPHNGNLLMVLIRFPLYTFYWIKVMIIESISDVFRTYLTQWDYVWASAPRKILVLDMTLRILPDPLGSIGVWWECLVQEEMAPYTPYHLWIYRRDWRFGKTVVRSFYRIGTRMSQVGFSHTFPWQSSISRKQIIF